MYACMHVCMYVCMSVCLSVNQDSNWHVVLLGQTFYARQRKKLFNVHAESVRSTNRKVIRFSHHVIQTATASAWIMVYVVWDGAPCWTSSGSPASVFFMFADIWRKEPFRLRVIIRYWARWMDREGQTYLVLLALQIAVFRNGDWQAVGAVRCRKLSTQRWIVCAANCILPPE
jgi:hypothetical protein